MGPAVVIYTVITANYDRAKPINLPGVRCVMVTDGPGAAGWETMPLLIDTGSPRHNSRHPKCVPHLYFPDASFTLYFDGAFHIRKDPLWLLDHLWLDPVVDCALFAHHGGHKSHHDERRFYQKIHGYVPEDVERHYQRLVATGVPDTGRFWACGVIARWQDDATKRHGQQWWNCYETGSCNDQLAFVEALHHAPMSVGTISGVNIQQPDFPWAVHGG